MGYWKSDDKITIIIDAENNASIKFKQMANDIDATTKEAEKSSESMSKTISKSLRDLNYATRHYNNFMRTFNREIIDLFQNIGSVIYDFTSDAIDNFTELSEQHAKTLGAMANNYDKTSESQAKFLADSEKLKQQAITIGAYGPSGEGSLSTVTQVSEMQTALIKAGLSADDILTSNTTGTVLQFAQANEIDTDTAVDFTVALANQFDVALEDWGSMLDKVSHTADLSIVEISDIMQSMKYASGVSSGIGLEMEDVLGMISIFGDFGLKGSQAGSGIQALLTRLLTGDTTVISQAMAEVAPPVALEAFYNFSKYAKSSGSGITYDDILNETFTEEDITGNLLPIEDVISQLDEVMSGLNDEEQAWFAKKFFGLYQMKSAYALINGDDSDLEEVIANIKTQSEDTNQNKLELLLNSQYGMLASLGNLYDATKTDIGDRLSPITEAIRTELYTFLKSSGKYKINFDNLRSAIEESADLIDEKYGESLSTAVRNLGGFAIDLAESSSVMAPDVAKGSLAILDSFASGNIFGKNGVLDNWSTMMDNMEVSASTLPDDLKDMGNAIQNVISMFGTLAAINVVTQIAELISSVLQILTIAGGAIINVGSAVITGVGAVAGTMATNAATTAVASTAGAAVGKAGFTATGQEIASTVASGATVGSAVKAGLFRSLGGLGAMALMYGTGAGINALGNWGAGELDEYSKVNNTDIDVLKTGTSGLGLWSTIGAAFSADPTAYGFDYAPRDDNPVQRILAGVNNLSDLSWIDTLNGGDLSLLGPNLDDLFTKSNDLNNNINSSSITVEAPTVNVDVTVDGEGNIISQEISVIDPAMTVKMDNYYSKMTSRYGSTQ